jgi:hypothetical protein
MKKHLLRLFVAAAVLTSTAQAQGSPSDYKQLLDGQNFAFIAQWMSPLGSSAKQLTSPYYMSVSKDSVIADLPYSGKNNSAFSEISGTGIHFTSTKYTYSNKPGKKGWGVTIQIQDGGDGTQMYLKVAPDGSASLQVSCNSKDRISYSGYIASK